MLLGAVLGFFFLCLPYNASAETSQNLIDNGNWNGATYGNDPGGCCASISGSGALYDLGTDTIMFSYGRDILSQTIAINEALKASGVQVDGYNYGWTFRKISNSGRGGDTLRFEVDVKDSNGNLVETYVYDYSTFGQHDTWYQESGTETFAQSYLDPQSLTLRIIGKDGGFWAGYYGPEVKDVHLSLNYSANPCAGNPLYDTSCPGYAEAYAEMIYNQQCTANPLYDIGCAGYDAAFYTQQCTINPLYDSGCAGYEQAYFEQQCSINPLYDSTCVGYEQAYYDQQCSIDALYDTGCTGYAQAYLDQQCSINPLYDVSCSGYAAAYYDQQCSINPLYDSGCPGYEVAYYNEYVLPGLQEQEAEASGTSQDSTTAQNDLVVVQDPVATITQPQITGDVFVDQVIRGTGGNNNVIPQSPIDVAPTPVQTSEPVTETQVAETEEQQSEPDAIASLEAELNAESSGDVEERVEDGGDSEGSEGESGNSGDSEDGGSGGSESRQSSGATPEQKKQARENKIREIAKQRAMQLAETMSNAASLEAQQAVQATILSLMNFNPDFARYANGVPDGGDIYGGEIPDSRIPENGRGLLNGLASQILHDKMVDMQYD